MTCRQDRSFNLQFLKEEFDIGNEQIEALYQYAKFQFDCGNYSMASELLQVGVFATAEKAPSCCRHLCRHHAQLIKQLSFIAPYCLRLRIGSCPGFILLYDAV